MNDKKNCSYCQASAESLLQCSACASASYCNQRCQKSHWKEHKKSCHPFVLKEIPGKNFGLVATKTIKEGEVLMRDKPLLVQSRNLADRKNQPSKLEQFKGLTKIEQSQLLALYHENVEDSLEYRLDGIFLANACEVSSADAVALYPNIPRCLALTSVLMRIKDPSVSG